MNKSDITSKAPRWWLTKDGKLVYITHGGDCPKIYGATVLTLEYDPNDYSRATVTRSHVKSDKLHTFAHTLKKTIPSMGDTVEFQHCGETLEAIVIDNPIMYHSGAVSVQLSVPDVCGPTNPDVRCIIGKDVDGLTITKFCDKKLHQFIDPRCTC